LLEHARDALRLAEEPRLQARQAVRHREQARVERRGRDADLFVLRVLHVDAVRGERELEERPDEARSRRDQREEALRRQIEALQHALLEEDRLADETVVL